MNDRVVKTEKSLTIESRRSRRQLDIKKYIHFHNFVYISHFDFLRLPSERAPPDCRFFVSPSAEKSRLLTKSFKYNSSSSRSKSREKALTLSPFCGKDSMGGSCHGRRGAPIFATSTLHFKTESGSRLIHVKSENYQINVFSLLFASLRNDNLPFKGIFVEFKTIFLFKLIFVFLGGFSKKFLIFQL